MTNTPDTCCCESSLCHHGEHRCGSTDVRPAPVMYLQGSPMCERCIQHYLDSGYGIDVNDDGEPTPRLGYHEPERATEPSTFAVRAWYVDPDEGVASPVADTWRVFDSEADATEFLRMWVQTGASYYAELYPEPLPWEGPHSYAERCELLMPDTDTWRDLVAVIVLHHGGVADRTPAGYVPAWSPDDDEPCDCGGPRDGGYITHAEGAHPDCLAFACEPDESAGLAELAAGAVAQVMPLHDDEQRALAQGLRDYAEMIPAPTFATPGEPGWREPGGVSEHDVAADLFGILDESECGGQCGAPNVVIDNLEPGDRDDRFVVVLSNGQRFRVQVTELRQPSQLSPEERIGA